MRPTVKHQRCLRVTIQKVLLGFHSTQHNRSVPVVAFLVK